MRMHEYFAKYDSLSGEEALYEIPVRKEYLLRQIGHGKRVLDVGCLGGRISRLIMEQHNEVWGVEINPNAAEKARKLGVNVKVANVEDGLPFEGEHFDVVNAGELVEHLYDTRTFFAECNRVLRPGGILIFTTPNLNSLENRIRVATGGYLSMVGAYPEDHFGQHVRIFNLGKVRELCEQTGFEIRDVRGIFNLEPKRRLVEMPLRIAGRLAPGLSKLLIVKAEKEKNGALQ